MIKRLVNKVADYFDSTFNLDEQSRIKLQYSLEVIMGDLSKFIILLIIFTFMNKQIDFIYSSIALIGIRGLTGGLHFKTFIGCLVFSGFFFLLVIYSKNNITLENPEIFALCFGVVLIFLLFAPITGKTRPVYSDKKIMLFKAISIAFILFHLFMYFIANGNPYFIISIWVYIYQAIQLLISKGGLKYEVYKNVIQKTIRSSM